MFNGLNRRARDALRAVVLLPVRLPVFAACSARVARAADDFLDPAVAFKFSATEQPGEVVVHYKIADGYYMYRERFSFATRNGTADDRRAAIAGRPRQVRSDLQRRTSKRIAMS